MSIISTIKEMDKKFSWSFLGFILAIIFGLITLYLGFYKKNTPDLNFIVTANSSVFDIKENLGNLDVLYKGDSLSEKKQDLRILTFKVINQGDAPILQNYYDVNDPVGFSIVNGSIADDPKLIKATNKYLKEKLIIRKNPDGKVVFSNVILEPNESFELKVLILHDIGSNPTLETFGKVAGVNTINVLTNYKTQEADSLIENTFGGGVLANFVRFITYGLLFLLLILLMVATSEGINSFKNTRRKQKLVTIFKDYDSDKISDKDSFFFDYYLADRGTDTVNRIHEIMNNSELLKKLNQEKKKSPSGISENRLSFMVRSHTSLFLELEGEGLVFEEDGNIIADEYRLAVLTSFINFLKRKGEFKKDSLHARYNELKLRDDEIRES